MKPFYFDTHMHFDLYKNRKDVLSYINQNRSYTIAVTNLPDLYERYFRQGICEKYKYIRLALGFHPQLAKQYYPQIEKFERYLQTTKYIGEVGLDFSAGDLQEFNYQREIFQNIIWQCQHTENKILTVHSRHAEKDVLHYLEELTNCKVILHWYTGTLRTLDEAVDRGYYFSINQQMLQTKKCQLMLERIPLDKILLESDAPFTKGTRVEYSLKIFDGIYMALSKSYGLAPDDLSMKLRQNFKSVLRM